MNTSEKRSAFTTFKTSKPKKVKNPITDEDPRIDAAFEFLKTPIQPPDSCSIFSQHVASKLRQYDGNKREVIEHLVNTVFFDFAMGRYDYILHNQALSVPTSSITFAQDSTAQNSILYEPPILSHNVHNQSASNDLNQPSS